MGAARRSDAHERLRAGAAAAPRRYRRIVADARDERRGRARDAGGDPKQRGGGLHTCV